MFAVVRTGGKQYRVAPGDKIVVEKLEGDAGDRVTLSDVLLAGDSGNLQSTDGLTVAAEIVAQAKADKVTVFKKRRRHNYRRKKGHRQQHTILKIVAIGDQKSSKADGGAKESKAPKPKSAGAITSDEGAGEIAGKPTANPAPSGDEASGAAKPAKSAGGKKDTTGSDSAADTSTENAAPAKGGAKKAKKADK